MRKPMRSTCGPGFISATLVCGCLAACGPDGDFKEPVSKLQQQGKCRQIRQNISNLTEEINKLEAVQSAPPRTILQLWQRTVGPAGAGTDAADKIGEHRRNIQLQTAMLGTEGCPIQIIGWSNAPGTL
jgi:hypothetical protein